MDARERRMQWAGLGIAALAGAALVWSVWSRPLGRGEIQMESDPIQDYVLAFFDDALSTLPTRLLVVDAVTPHKDNRSFSVMVDGKRQAFMTRGIDSYAIPEYSVPIGWHEPDAINLATIRQPKP